MYDWNERPTKAQVDHIIGGDEPAAVFTIGKYQVTVPIAGDAEPPAVTYRCPRDHRGTDPRGTFPNMEVVDGELRFPVTDLVDVILSRIEPAELAQALWQNDEVKASFMDCLEYRYTEMGIDDADRRKFLHGVQEAVHSKAVDGLTEKLVSREFEQNIRAHLWEETNRINRVLRDLDVKVMRNVKNDAGDWSEEPQLLQFESREQRRVAEDGKTVAGEFEVCGLAWREAREFWRAEMLKRFPAPVEAPGEQPL